MNILRQDLIIKLDFLRLYFFLMQRGLQAGITIYAPSIILTTILGWDMTITVILVGSLIILYTVIGGSRAVSLTHKHQMTIIFIGLIVLFTFLLNFILKDISFYNMGRIPWACHWMCSGWLPPQYHFI